MFEFDFREIFECLNSANSNCVCVFDISGILQKMKEGAENVERKIQAKVESLKNANEADKGEQEKAILFSLGLFFFIYEIGCAGYIVLLHRFELVTLLFTECIAAIV